MNFAEFRDYCLAKPGVTEDYPFTGETAWMKVMGKLFALASMEEVKKGKVISPPFEFFNVKCDPDLAVELRDQYEFVKPGWHMNKKHWNSVYTNGVSDTFLKEQIDRSYELVVKALPKKDKEALRNF